MASSLTWTRRSRAPWRGLAALLLAACAALCLFMVAERASGQEPLGAPTIGTVTIAPVSLTVNWSAPAQTGGSAITAYDVRYILTSATDKADEHWTLARVTGGSTLQHAVTGLRDSTSYDIQVRAVNADGDGPWPTPARTAVTTDHGDTIATATTVTLDSSVDGWIDAAGDDDLFQIALSNPVELWAYTRSGFDTAGHLLHHSGIQLALDADSLYPFGEKNFALRHQLEEGTYYIRVRGNAGVSTGTYTLHIRAVQDPGSTASAATPIDLHGVQAGHAGSGSSADYFQLTVAADTWVKLQAIAAAPVSLTATVSNGEGTEVPAFILGRGYWEGNMVTHLAFELVAFLPAGTYVIQVTNEAGATGGRYVLHVGVSEDDQRLHDRCSAFATSLGDPLSGCQWHLSNTGAVQAGGARKDINVANAWLTTKGEGVTVAVVDGGLDSGHADLRDNVLVSRNHNYLGTGDIRNLTNDHGTNVAGLIAARDNGVGMLGVAPRATIYAYNLVALFARDGFNQAKAADAATRHVAETAVSNNSWGEGSDGRPKFADAVWEQAIERGLTEGFGGKGTTYVWAGGNGGDADYSNLDERLSHYGVIAACSVNYNDVRDTLSEKGSNLWVCAPSDDGARSLPQIATTSSRGGYTDTFGGTSAAAAIVSGVAALVRAANLDLTWRDVKLILAASARKNDAGNSGWQVGATKYRSDTDTEHYWFNHEYGFGTVDAGAAVALAGSWTNVPAQPALPALRTMTLTSADTDLNLPDLGTVTTRVTAESDYVEFVEFIAVKIDIDHDGFRNLRIELTSPSAAVSVLTTEIFFRDPSGPSRALRRSLRLGSARHLGEHPAGTWSMSIRDHYAPDDGTLKSWSMTVYGHGFSPGYPTITEAVRTGTFLTVHWAAPSDAGASAISAYDLRYIRSDATDKSNSAWSPPTGISSSGALRHELTGLTEDVEYDLQVRAINSDGTGPWSEVFSGSTVAAVPGAPAITTVTPGRERLTVSWSAPAEDGGVAITGYNLRHIPNDASAAEKAVDDNWTLQSPAWSEGSGDLEAAIGGLTGGVKYDVQVRATNRAGSGDWSTPATGTTGSNSAPQFADTRPQLTVPENSPAQTRVGDPLQATDADGDSLMYTLTGSDLFEIDIAQGQITVAEGAVLNHEAAPSHSVMVTVSDPRDATDTDALTILVSDVNEAPEFTAVPAERSVSENASPGAKVGVPVIATDVDGDLLGYRLQGAPEFEIDEDTGQIQVAPGVTLDRERTPSYEVTVTASDGKGGTDSITVTINVSNVNEAPTAVNDTATTDEDQSVRIDVLANDTDPDTERAALTVSVLRDPLDGAARVESDRTITYTPNANFAGENSFTYSVSDGSLSDAGSVTVTVEAVNDAPAFAAVPAERSVPEDAEADDNVGAPVTATDIDNAMLTYSLSGADASSFDIDSDGQITVATGVTFDIATQETYVVTVTADDGSGEANATATVEVTITVTAGPVRPIIIITGGGGGGGGGPSGPTPSEVDFEWNVTRDIEQLDAANDRATGLWSDGTTLWVADNADGAGDAVYAYDLESGERVEEREFALHETNRAPRGFWSDRSVVWVSDSGRERLFAYRLADGERLEEREFALAAGNSDARGIWSDEETMWVLDGHADALFAYDFESGEVLAEYELDSANDDPRGIWSDGVTIWVSDHGAKRLFAYRLPVLPDEEAGSGEEGADGEARELERVSDEEFTELSKASNNSPRGLWSDGDVMYVADESDDKVYTYNMPDAIDARLASLTLSGVDIGEFDPGRPDYEGTVGEGVVETAVEAEAMQPRTDVAIDPPDADGDDANGRQVALQDLGEITVTVTSQDGSRTRVYRVQFPDTGWDAARDPWPHCLRGAVSEGFSLVVFEGGSVEELVSCAESRDIVALYALHEGVYVSHILGAPDFVNAGFVELFPDGLPPITPLVAGSNGPPAADPFGDLEDGGQQPWPQCLRGDIAAGFSLVVYEGGGVDELEACAQSRDVAALYALHGGVWISYNLGAPDFVNGEFREQFADGLPAVTPLVAKSEGPPEAN